MVSEEVVVIIVSCPPHSPSSIPTFHSRCSKGKNQTSMIPYPTISSTKVQEVPRLRFYRPLLHEESQDLRSDGIQEVNLRGGDKTIVVTIREKGETEKEIVRVDVNGGTTCSIVLADDTVFHSPPNTPTIHILPRHKNATKSQ